MPARRSPSPTRRRCAKHERLGFGPAGIHREVGRKCGTYWDVAWLEKPLRRTLQSVAETTIAASAA